MSDSSNDFLSTRCEYPLLVVLQSPQGSSREASAHLRELEGLTQTLGMKPVRGLVLPLRRPHPRYLIGTGKTAQLEEMIEETKADLVVFDDDLTPSQQRNLESRWDTTVIDRREIILDIFSSRASTREAELQVELARLEYMMPRLTRAWSHLSRQKGGTKGTRGEGEKQLEADRRIVQNRLTRLRRELREVSQTRETRRKQRQSGTTPRASLVGYTNAGKSSLLNALANSEVMVKNQLFATLDPTTRQVPLPRGGAVLITDTVGFIRKLPHHLVDAFRSTLEETREADFLIHVVDIADPEWESQLETSRRVLQELESEEKPTLYVFNKSDKLSREEQQRTSFILQEYPHSCLVSLKTGAGIPDVLEHMEGMISRERPSRIYALPRNRYDLAARLHREAQVLHREEGDKAVWMEARTSEELARQLAPFEKETYPDGSGVTAARAD